MCKRVGNRLHKLKKTIQGLGGGSKRPIKVIDRLQYYYGIAIRTNVGNLEGMKKPSMHRYFMLPRQRRTNGMITVRKE